MSGRQAHEGTEGYAAILDDVTARLRAAGCVFAEDEAAILLSSAGSDEELQELLGRRVAGYPLEHIVGWAEFHGVRITVLPAVFVPRRRTEFLVDCAAKLIPAPTPGSGRQGSAVVVLDMCCGSGAVGAVLGLMHPGTIVHAADIDPAAVACARLNLAPVGGEAHLGDLFGALPDALRGSLDMVVANAPYVPSQEIVFMPPEARLHEPGTALDGGSDGLELQRRIAESAPGWLRPGGHLLMETSRAQAATSRDILVANGFAARILHHAGLDATVVTGRLRAR